MAADREIDARGFRCPLPVLRAQKALRDLAPGARLVLLADDPMAAIDIPHFCAESGHLLERAAGDRFVICKRGGPAPGHPAAPE
jgi:tRNA 2-thiouridine synthesizing protein A